MAKKNTPTPQTSKDMKPSELEELVMQCEQELNESDLWISNLRDTWDEKELMLIGKTDDSLSGETNSRVYEPRLSTLSFERSARVMAQNPRGKFFGTSQNDIGKTLLMNLLVDHFRKKDNFQYSHLMKLRMADLYSSVYGSQFMLVPWKVNLQTGYMGPSTEILNMRDCFPQPGVRNLNEAERFTHRNEVSIEWLKKQDPKWWMMDEIERLDADMKALRAADARGSAKNINYQSAIERTYYPSRVGDTVYPAVEIFTTYRKDQWITFAPKMINQETGKPYMLRRVMDPYPNYMLPVVAKHCFPLLDSPIGLGEFERGKTLQYALNSLWNLYLDGVKYSIFPPIAVDPSNVVPTSIKWGLGERWFMNNPGRDVQAIQLSPQGLQSFQSTYQFIIGAIHAQNGSANISSGGESTAGLGRTPDAMKMYAAAENARDEWDRFMMEETIKDIYERWGGLITTKLEKKVELRLFGDEIKRIEREYSDVGELLNKSKKVAGRSIFRVGKGDLDTAYDFELEAGSTVKPSLEQESADVTEVIKAFTENPNLIKAMQDKGKDIDFGELMQRWVSMKIKDPDRIIVDFKPVGAAGAAADGALTPGTPQVDEQGNPIPPQTPVSEEMPAEMPVDMPPAEEAPQEVPAGDGPQFKDPDIAAAAARVLGGDQMIPPSQSY